MVIVDTGGIDKISFATRFYVQMERAWTVYGIAPVR